MNELWPWYTAAAAGALHGLHPAGGWVVAAAWGMRRQSRHRSVTSSWRGVHGVMLALSVAAFATLALHDAGLAMAPLMWSLCSGTGGLPRATSLLQAASLVAVHLAAWAAVSLGLAAATRWAAQAWHAGRPAPTP